MHFDTFWVAGVLLASFTRFTGFERQHSLHGADLNHVRPKHCITLLGVDPLPSEDTYPCC